MIFTFLNMFCITIVTVGTKMLMVFTHLFSDFPGFLIVLLTYWNLMNLSFLIYLSLETDLCFSRYQEIYNITKILQMDYINTSHPNFIGGHKAVQTASQQITSSKVPLPIARQKVIILCINIFVVIIVFSYFLVQSQLIFHLLLLPILSFG